MIQITDLKKSYGRTLAVNIPSLSIYDGEIVGLVGNNGAGKTTFLRLVLDLLETDNGCVAIDGKIVGRDVSWKKRTGSYIDSGFLIEFLTAEEFFRFVGNAYGLPYNVVEDRLADFDRLMGGEILSQKKYIRSFSAGNKQKVGIIAAMIIHPGLLVLDEPFNFLDPSSQIEMKHLIRKMNSEFGTTMLISSHNLDHIVDVSSRIILLEKGLIIKDINNTRKVREELRHYFEK